MTDKQSTDGTIFEFLHGSHSFNGIWFGEPHPILKGNFWWRKFLPTQQDKAAHTVTAWVDEQINDCEKEIAAAAFLIMHNVKEIKEYWKGKRDAFKETQQYIKSLKQK